MDVSIKVKEEQFEEKIQSIEMSHKNEQEVMKKSKSKMQKQMVEWRTKSATLRYEHLLLNRKRKRVEGKVMEFKKYPKLVKEHDELVQKQKEMEETIKNLKVENDSLLQKVPAVDKGTD